MHVGVAVHLAAGGLQVAGAARLGEAQQALRAHHAGQQRLLRLGLVERGGSDAGEIVDLLDPAAGQVRRRLGHVGLHELELRMIRDRSQVLAGAGDEIVEADHPAALGQQPLAQVRSEKARSAGHQHPAVASLAHAPHHQYAFACRA